MSRRASVFAKEHPGNKPKVRFPDELVFLDNVRENDVKGMDEMLRRASVQLDINAINDAGLTPLHQAVLDGNMGAVRLLVAHGASIDRRDEDTWTPLHAACSVGEIDIVKFLLKLGADKTTVTDQGERPIDLVDSDDFPLIAVMLDNNRTWAQNDSDTSTSQDT